MTDFRIVFVTLPDHQTGLEIARAVVAERLCACANLVGGLTSIYTWKNKIEESSEILMIIKTHECKLAELERRIRTMHPYEVFEFVAMPITYGNHAYLSWIKDAI